MTIVTIAQSQAAQSHATSAAAMPVKSPCVGICQLNADQLCTGCGRLLGEIAEWGRATTDRQQQIKADAARRLAILEAADTATVPPSTVPKGTSK